MELESANRSKLQELNERLKNVDRRPEDDYDVLAGIAQSRFVYMESKLIGLEDRIHKAAALEDNRLRALEGDLHKLEEHAKSEKREFEVRHH